MQARNAAPTTKNFLAPNVNSAKADKPFSKMKLVLLAHRPHSEEEQSPLLKLSLNDPGLSYLNETARVTKQADKISKDQFLSIVGVLVEGRKDFTSAKSLAGSGPLNVWNDGTFRNQRNTFAGFKQQRQKN